ncbi:hypothetical protein I6N95_04230, partial [Vagococcus sp. BWB3-3]
MNKKRNIIYFILFMLSCGTWLFNGSLYTAEVTINESKEYTVVNPQQSQDLEMTPNTMMELKFGLVDEGWQAEANMGKQWTNSIVNYPISPLAYPEGAFEGNIRSGKIGSTGNIYNYKPFNIANMLDINYSIERKKTINGVEVPSNVNNIFGYTYQDST